MQTESVKLPRLITPLIDALTNVVVIENGAIVKNTLSETALTITNDMPQSLIDSLFQSDNPVVQHNQKAAEAAYTFKITANRTLEAPINLFIIQKDRNMSQNLTFIVGEHAGVTVNEYIYGNDGSTVDYVSQAVVEAAGKLDYHGIVNLDAASISSINRMVSVKQDGKAFIKTAQMGNGNTQQDTRIDLLGPLAIGEIKTVALSSAKQEVLIRSIIEHKAKHTEGLIEQYGVAADESFLMFEGVGKIHKGMSKSIAKQHNKGVVLGEKARLDANPLLLIDEYDVEAGHGAAIGQIDEEQLYYLMSRGLSEKDAQRLIINGYLHPLEKLLENDIVKKHIESLLENKTA